MPLNLQLKHDAHPRKYIYCEILTLKWMKNISEDMRKAENEAEVQKTRAGVLLSGYSIFFPIDKKRGFVYNDYND